MKLEDRVKALEMEVKVLKNEIQSTLLDIQEQLLVHYYPSLRAEDRSSPTDTVPSGPATLSGNGQGQQQQAPTPPLAKETAPTWAEQAEQEAVVARAQPNATLTGAPTARPTFNELIEWVSHSVERIGIERTARVISLCSESGALPVEQKEILLQLIALSDEENPPEKVTIRQVLDSLIELNRLLGYEADMLQTLVLAEEMGIG